jgi:antitoxin component of MazEF toxin-antitoxin module
MYGQATRESEGMRKKITTSGNSAALVVPREFLAQMGLKVGDEVELTMIDRTLVARAVAQVTRDKKVKAAVDDVFRRRRSTLKRLAE